MRLSRIISLFFGFPLHTIEAKLASPAPAQRTLRMLVKLAGMDEALADLRDSLISMHTERIGL